MIKEVIVVEGRADVAAVKRAVQAEVITTDGYAFGKAVITRVRNAQKRCGVIILTDPDNAGESIRRRLHEAVPGCKHARIARQSCDKQGNIGVENASVEAIREALGRAHIDTREPSTEFDVLDMRDYGLTGCPEASDRRRHLGEALHLGFTNAKQLLARLNHYHISREEVESILEALDTNTAPSDDTKTPA